MNLTSLREVKMPSRPRLNGVVYWKTTRENGEAAYIHSWPLPMRVIKSLGDPEFPEGQKIGFLKMASWPRDILCIEVMNFN